MGRADVANGTDAVIAFVEVVVGVAVVLLAGYLIAEHRDRIRQIASATALGLTADKALSDASHDSGDDHRHHGHSHPTGPHWDATDAPPDSTDST